VYEQHYVEIEGTWHTAAEGERTECGLRIPYPGTPWTRVAPEEKVHCGVELPEGTTDIRPEPEMPFAAPEPATKVVEAEKPAAKPAAKTATKAKAKK
jgi:hypothetical protein